MRQCHAVWVLSLIAAAAGCSTTGKMAVHVETGNQSSGYLSRPLVLTTSSDESVQLVAQAICDNVKPGSDARITFVGKVPDPDPLSVGQRGRYRYDCQAPVRVMTQPAPVMPGAAVAAATTTAAPAVPAAAAPLAPAPPLAPAAAAPPGAAATALAPGTADATEEYRRQCLRQQGAYQICLGSCALGSTSPAARVEEECRQRCLSLQPAGCGR